MRKSNFKKIAISAIASAVLLSSSTYAVDIADGADVNSTAAAHVFTGVENNATGTLNLGATNLGANDITATNNNVGTIKVDVDYTMNAGTQVGLTATRINTLNVDTNATLTLDDATAAFITNTNVTAGSTLDLAAGTYTGTTVTNAGTITGTGELASNITNSGTATISTITGDVTNSGTLTSGTLITGDVTNTGTLTAVTVTGDINNTSTLTATDAITGDITNTGTLLAEEVIGDITNTGGTVTLSAALTGNILANSGDLNATTVSGTLTSTSGTVIVSTIGGAVSNAGTLTATTVGGNITNSGDINATALTGNLVSTSGTVGLTTISGTVANGGTLVATTIGGAVDNNGTATFTAITGAVVNSGTLTATTLGAGITNLGTATATVTDVTGDVINECGTLNTGTIAAGTINNRGTMTTGIVGGTTPSALINRGSIETTGAFSATTAELESDSTIVATGAVIFTGAVEFEDEGMKDGVDYILATGSAMTAGTLTQLADTTMIDYTLAVVGANLVATADYATANTLGLTGNTAATYAKASTAISSDTAILAAMNGMTATQIDAAVATFAPEISAAGVGALNLVSGAIGTVGTHMKVARANGTATGIAAGDAMKDVTLWGQYYHTDTDQNDKNGISGYDAKGNGLVVGMDKQVNDSTLIGMAFSFGNNDVDSKNTTTRAKTDIDTKQLSAYISKSFGNFYVDGVLAYATNDNDGSRHVVVGAVDRTAKSSYDSTVKSMKLGMGTSTKVLNGLTLSPSISYAHATLTTDSYTETGAGAMNLTVNSDSMTQQTLAANFALSKSIKGDNGSTFTPELRLGMERDFGDKYATTSSTFSGGGSSFATNGLEADKTKLVYGLGANYVTANKMTEVKFGIDQTKADGYTSDAATLTVRYKF